jgi:hypothetical protein
MFRLKFFLRDFCDSSKKQGENFTLEIEIYANPTQTILNCVL